MALNKNALLSIKEYYEMAGNSSEGNLEERNMIENIINAVSTQFEKFCNRVLVERKFTHDVSDTENYDVSFLYYSIFDAPKLATIYLPTYPVSSITKLEISGIEISAAASDDYDASNGYILYTTAGRIIYSPGFDFP